MSNQHTPTRQAALLVHWNEMLDRTGLSKLDWAERVDREYCARVSKDKRRLPAPELHLYLNDAETHSKLKTAWAQQIHRYTNGGMNFPLELEEAWIAALDEPYRTRCLHELASRINSYYVPRHEPGQSGDMTCLSVVIKEVSDVVKEGANGITEKTVKEAHEAIAALHGLIRRSKIPVLLKVGGDQ